MITYLIVFLFGCGAMWLAENVVYDKCMRKDDGVITMFVDHDYQIVHEDNACRIERCINCRDEIRMGRC